MCLILDYLYDVPCKIIHAPALERNGKLHHSLFEHVDDVKNHFKKFGSPVMMGGDVDASSKGNISKLWIKSVSILFSEFKLRLISKNPNVTLINFSGIFGIATTKKKQIYLLGLFVKLLNFPLYPKQTLHHQS